MKKILISTGGTGGHVMPALALYDHYKNNFNTFKSNKNFNKLIKSKKIWCAASTHPGEEELCLEIHLKLIKRYPNLLLILIPRHVERINDLRRDLIKHNLKYHIHSDNRSINKETKLY